jgi:uncharacterized membrane protein SpoIIM required for sporulation
MEVLIWQIGVLLTIVIIGFFGKSARIGITAFAVLFTIVMVFTSGLMILQFATIGLGYWLSDSLVKEKEIELTREQRYRIAKAKESSTNTFSAKFKQVGCMFVFGLILIGLLTLFIYPWIRDII